MYFNEIEQDHYESQQRRYLDELSLEKQEERKIKNAVDTTKFEIAKSVKKNGVNFESIIKSKGLSKGQIDRL